MALVLTMTPTEEIINSYELADEFARKVTQFREAVGIPANNELRYAGHHVLQSLVESLTPKAVEDHRRMAKNHCHRAMYEAAEAGLTRAIDEINDFQETYGGEGIVIVSLLRSTRADTWSSSDNCETGSSRWRAAETILMPRSLRSGRHLADSCQARSRCRPFVCGPVQLAAKPHDD